MNVVIYSLDEFEVIAASNGRIHTLQDEEWRKV
jgi:hypothetical protein